MLPEWVSQPAAPRRAGRRRAGGALSRTLRASARLVGDAVFAERVARQPGFLQGLAARAKLISLVGLLVAASFLHHLASLWLLAAWVIAAAGISKVGVRVLLHRVWWLLPTAFLVVTIPAIFGPITPGEPLVTLYRAANPPRIGFLPLPAELAITRQGLAAAGLVVTRIVVGVLLGVTLVLTTRWQELLKAAYIGVTAPFVLILAMAYRYVFVLLRTVEAMHLGRQARTIVPSTAAEQRRWAGSRVAVLFLRSRRLSEEVYQAMLARGYRGEPKALAASRVGAPEAVWLLGCLAIAGICLFLDRVLLAGVSW